MSDTANEGPDEVTTPAGAGRDSLSGEEAIAALPARCALVTGGSGFIGGHLCERLVDNGWTVKVLDIRRPELDREVSWLDADVRDGAAVAAGASGADVVFHLGAVVGVDRLLADPVKTIDVIVNGTKNALEGAALAGAALVHLSSSEVLGSNPNLPWSEGDERVIGSALTDRWSYAAAKAAAEHIVLAGAPSRSVPATVIRPFNVYGPRQDARFVIPLMVRSALLGEPVKVYDTGEQTRCFTFVDDAVDAIVAAGDKPGLGRLFHIGTTDEITMESLARLVISLCQSSSIVQHVSTADRWAERFEHVPRRAPNPAHASAVLGWSSRITLDEGLRRTIESVAGTN